MKLSAPRNVTWVVSLALYVIALAAAFGVLQIRADVALWSWVIGYGLLLVACQLRRL
jgi:hypothetical protein